MSFLLGTGSCLGLVPPWKFLVYGDSRGPDTTTQINSTIIGELAQVTLAEKPAFVLVPGDLVNSGNLAAFQQWTNLMAPVYQAGIGVYPVIGNHDAADVASYIKVFGAAIPDNGPAGEINRTYSFTYANALFLVLDAYIPNRTMRLNQPWVDAVLATNRQPHVFAMSHVPAFKVGHTDCLDDYAPERNAFWKSLSNAQCRMYFCGHDHFFDHMRVDDQDGNTNNDVHQVILGTAGAPLAGDGAYDGNNGLWKPTRIFHEAQYGYLSVQVDGDTVRSTWHHRTRKGTYTATTEQINYSLKPVVPPLAFSYSRSRLAFTWSGSGVLQAAASLTGTFTNVPNATSPYVITNLNQGSRYYRLVAP